MITEMNYYVQNKLYHTDSTTDFNSLTGLINYFNNVKMFLINKKKLFLKNYEIRECNIDKKNFIIDLYCTLKNEESDNNQKKLFDFKK